MTAAQMIRRFRQTVGYDFDPVFGQYPEGGDAPTLAAWTSDVVGFLNDAAYDLAKISYLTADRTSLTLTAGVGTYSLSSSAWSARLIAPLTVIVDGRRLPDVSGAGYGLWSIDDLTRRFPNWSTDAPGTPQRAVFRGDRLIIHPAPAVGGIAYVDGKIGPTRIRTDDLDEECELPEDLHRHVVGLAVYDACKDNAQQGTQFARLSAMRDEAMAKAMEIQRESLNDQIGPLKGRGRVRVDVMRL